MGEEHNDFREALMRAWVRGWYAGRGDRGPAAKKKDDGKRPDSAEVAAMFPALDANAELLAACKLALALTEPRESKVPVPMPNEPGFREAVAADLADYQAQNEAAEVALRAAIAKAEGRK